jgi:TRAP transporter 4TM/12TM fusion protein
LSPKNSRREESALQAELRFRQIRGWLKIIFFTLAGILWVFHLYTSYSGTLEAYIHRSTHLTLLLMLVFIFVPMWRKGASSKKLLALDISLALIAAFIYVYQWHDKDDFLMRAGSATRADLTMGAILILMVIEATRRTQGYAMTLIVVLFLLYTRYGPYFPEILAHAGFNWTFIVDFQFMTLHGVYGIPLGVMSTFIIIFIMFGALLESTGAGAFFIDLAYGLFGHRVGGPAKAAVGASALMGTISGSAVANVVTTGAFTIPLMKRTGYSPTFAAATEAAASSGGQLMPPIMGASAFLMAEFLGIPYIQVCLAAAFPAVLYFLSVGCMVHFEALRLGIRGTPKDQLPRLGETMKWGGHLLIPIGVILYLMARFFTPMMAGFWAIVTLVFLSFVRQRTALDWGKLLRALESCVKSAMGVTIVCAAAGIIIGCFVQTGLSTKFSTLILQVSAGKLWLILIMAMLFSLVLGMGIPTVGAYVLVAIFVAPILSQFGISPIAAHLFAFYFAIISAVTPPVAIAAYAGAGLAGSQPFSTGLMAFRLTIAGFLIPYVFIYGPSLLLQGTVQGIFWGISTTFIGIVALAAGVGGFFFRKTRTWERILLVICAVFLIKSGLFTDLIGFASLAVVILAQKRDRSKGSDKEDQGLNREG